VLQGDWHEVPSQSGLQFLTDTSSATENAGYICTTTGVVLEVTPDNILQLDTPGECEAFASASGRLIASFRRKGIYEYEGGTWHLLATHPYPSGEGAYWAYIAAYGAELSYAITGKPVVDRTVSAGRDMKFTRNAPTALWVFRAGTFQQVMFQ
jgi:hypothetical protein